MDNSEYRTYQLLEALDKDVNVSQRHLALKLNISLGLVNSFLKRLAAKGYCKVVSIPKNRVKYILTPEGAAEKTRLTYNYIKYSYDLYKASHGKIQNIFNRLSADGIKSVYFYGATEVAEIASAVIKGSDINLLGIVDDLKVGEDFSRYKIIGLQNLKLKKSEKIIVTANDLSIFSVQSLLDIGIKNDQIVKFDQ